MVSFAAGALVVSALLAAGTYVAARHYLVDQREQLALRQAYADASFVRQGLLTAGAQEGAVIGELSPPAGSDVLVRRNGQYFSSALGSGSTAVPASVSERAARGVVSLAWTRTSSGPAVVVGVPLPAVRTEFYEISTTDELAETLRTLATVLVVAAVLTTLGGALLGRTAARRLLAPLDSFSGAAADIAVGRLETRLPGTEDPDLAVLVASFNTMVETVQERIERDARFAADLSHELRSPLTTLTASVGVLLNRRSELSERGQRALDLVALELERLRQSLEDLLALGRLDAGVAHRELAETDLRDLVRHSVVDGRRSAAVLHLTPVPSGDAAESPAGPGGRPGEGGAGDAELADDPGPLPVLVDRLQMHRALLNLYGNAEAHGEGLAAVRLQRHGDHALVIVDDRGPGVAPEDRQRIFERFARAGSRGSRPGTGLGLSIVDETVRAHGGSVWCDEAPGGGARFVVRLPLLVPGHSAASRPGGPA
jgi:two-component system sensor histidine kinase MtrB